MDLITTQKVIGCICLSFSITLAIIVIAYLEHKEKSRNIDG